MKALKNKIYFKILLQAIALGCISNVFGQTTNWTKIYFGFSWALTVGETGEYWVNGLTKVEYSKNHGANWTDAKWPLGVIRENRSLAPGSAVQGKRMIFAALDNGTYYTSNYGTTWTQIGPSGFGCQSFSMIALANKEVLFTMTGFQRGIYKLDTSAASYSIKFAPGSGAAPDPNHFAADKNGYIYVSVNPTNHAVNSGIYKSSDNGNSWSQILSTSYKKNPQNIAIYNDTLYYIDANGVVYGSDLKTISFYKIDSTSIRNASDFVISRMGDFLISSSDSGLYVSKNKGLNWSRQSISGVSRYNRITIEKDTVFIGTDQGVYKSVLSFSSKVIQTTCATGTVTWDGGGSDERFFTKENWVGDLCPCAGADLLFNGTGSNTKHCILDSSLTLGTITLNSTYKGRFSVSGNGVVLKADTLDSQGPIVQFANNTGTADISVLIAGRNASIGLRNAVHNAVHVGNARLIYGNNSEVEIGNLNLRAFAQFNAPQDGKIYLTGHLNVAQGNSFFSRRAKIHFTGTGNQNVDLALANRLKMVPLVVNKASGSLVLQHDLSVDTLSLTSGNINTGIYRLTLTAPGGLSGGNSNSYINGNVSIDHSSAWPGSKMRLPIGKGSKYRPITLHNTSSDNDWDIEFIDTDPNTLGAAGSPLTDISTDGYWNTVRSAGGNGLLADATYFEISDAGKGAWSNSDLRVALFDGSNWNSIGGSFTSNAVISSDTSLHGNVRYRVALGQEGAIPAPIMVDPVAAANTALQFSLYPNPVSATLHIALSGTDKGSISLTDLSGKVLGIYSADTRSIDMSRFAAGVYFATFSNGEQRITHRVTRN